MHDPTHSRFRHLPADTGRYRRYVRDDNGDPVRQPPAQAALPDIPAHGTYGSLLFHPKWKARRQEILQRDNHRCAVCGSVEELQVHHRQYHFVVRDNRFKDPWDYPDRLLLTLCSICHRKGHSRYKVPVIHL